MAVAVGRGIVTDRSKRNRDVLAVDEHMPLAVLVGIGTSGTAIALHAVLRVIPITTG